MRIAYKHPLTKKIRQYETDEKLKPWEYRGKRYYIIGVTAVPVEDVKVIDEQTLKQIKKIEAKIEKLIAKINQILTENFHNFSNYE